MLIYFLIYLFLILTAFIFDNSSNVTSRDKKFFLFGLVLVFTLFRGLRWQTGTDWDQFYRTFLDAKWSNIFTYSRYEVGSELMEYGYMFLNVLVKELGGNYTTFLLLSNFFVLFSYSKFSLKFSEKPLIAFAVILFSSQFFPGRQILASGIFLFGYVYVVKGMFFKFLLVTIAASSIHTSALIGLPFYFVQRIRISDAVAILIVFLTPLGGSRAVQEKVFNFMLPALKILGENISHRLQVYMSFTKILEEQRVSLFSISLTLFFLIIFIYIRRKEPYKNSKSFNVFFNTYLIFFFLTEFFRNSMEQFSRMANYYVFGLPILAGVCLGFKQLPPKIFPLIYSFLFLYMFYKFYMTLNYLYPELHVPYRSVFDYF